MFTFFAISGRSPSQISLTLLLPSLSLDYCLSDQSAGVHAFHLPVRSNVKYHVWQDPGVLAVLALGMGAALPSCLGHSGACVIRAVHAAGGIPIKIVRGQQ